MVISFIELDAGYNDAITVGNFTQLYGLFIFFVIYVILSKSLKQTQLPGMYHVKEIHDKIIFLPRILTLDRPISIPYASKTNLPSPNILDHLPSPSQWETLFNPQEPIVSDKLVSRNFRAPNLNIFEQL